MKTLKELSETCILIASFKQPAFVAIEGYAPIAYNRSNLAYLYYDNKGIYYLYKFITKSEIIQFDNMTDALERFVTFVSIVLKVDK